MDRMKEELLKNKLDQFLRQALEELKEEVKEQEQEQEEKIIVTITKEKNIYSRGWKPYNTFKWGNSFSKCFK